MPAQWTRPLSQGVRRPSHCPKTTPRIMIFYSTCLLYLICLCLWFMQLNMDVEGQKQTGGLFELMSHFIRQTAFHQYSHDEHVHEQIKHSYSLAHRGRRPPPHFDGWISFAMEKQCSLDHGDYSRIEKDLDIFRNYHLSQLKNERAKEKKTKGNKEPESMAVIKEDMLEKIKRIPYLVQFQLVGGDVVVTPADANVGLRAPIRKALLEFADRMPNLTFWVNALDEPRILKRAPLQHRLPGLNYDPNTRTFEVGADGNAIPLMEQVCDPTKSESIELEREPENGSRKTNTTLKRNSSSPLPYQLEDHGFFLRPCSFIATTELVPVFSSASVAACFADILFPSHYYLRADTSVDWSVQLREEGEQLEQSPNNETIQQESGWEGRLPQLYWRGATTGGGAGEASPFERFHRHRFVSQFGRGGTDPSRYNIGFTSILQCAPDAVCERERRLYSPLSSPEPLSASKRYKYLADIDGNTFSQRFLPFLRFTGGLVFKMFAFEDWVTVNTRAWEHYVPVHLNLKDVESKMDWARDHDEEARRIAERAFHHARKRLRYDDMLCYFYRLLLEYHRLLLPTLEGDV